jgi:hypothetical protein
LREKNTTAIHSSFLPNQIRLRRYSNSNISNVLMWNTQRCGKYSCLERCEHHWLQEPFKHSDVPSTLI